MNTPLAQSQPMPSRESTGRSRHKSDHELSHQLGYKSGRKSGRKFNSIHNYNIKPLLLYLLVGIGIDLSIFSSYKINVCHLTRCSDAAYGQTILPYQLSLKSQLIEFQPEEAALEEAPHQGNVINHQGNRRGKTNDSLSISKAIFFLDLQSHWARPFWQSMQRQLPAPEVQKILTALRVDYSSGFLFRPNQIISRADFARFLQVIFVHQSTSFLTGKNTSFTDVSPDHPAYDAIQFAVKRGWLAGSADRTFSPDAPVSRGQALVAIAKALQLPIPSLEDSLTLVTDYQDSTEIPRPMVGSVAALRRRELVVNFPNHQQLNLTSGITRGDLLALIHQMYVDRRKITKMPSVYISPAIPSKLDLRNVKITRLEVHLFRRTVTAYAGAAPIKTYPIAVGRAGWETPKGTYRVQQLVKDPAWQNPFNGEVIPSNDPDNPLGDRWIGFWSDGKNWAGFHGTSNRNSVGQAASHGCLRMYSEDIRELFEIVSLDTVVQVLP